MPLVVVAKSDSKEQLMALVLLLLSVAGAKYLTPHCFTNAGASSKCQMGFCISSRYLIASNVPHISEY